MSDFEALPLGTAERLRRLEAAVKPFAEYADPRNLMPASLPISNGSSMARQQLTMGDCYAARDALAGAELVS